MMCVFVIDNMVQMWQLVQHSENAWMDAANCLALETANHCVCLWCFCKIVLAIEYVTHSIHAISWKVIKIIIWKCYRPSFTDKSVFYYHSFNNGCDVQHSKWKM